MDASDIIKSLRDKTTFYNLQAKFSTAQSTNQCRPKTCVPSNNCSYQFIDYSSRLNYFNGRYE